MGGEGGTWRFKRREKENKVEKKNNMFADSIPTHAFLQHTHNERQSYPQPPNVTVSSNTNRNVSKNVPPENDVILALDETLRLQPSSLEKLIFKVFFVTHGNLNHNQTIRIAKAQQNDSKMVLGHAACRQAWAVMA